MKGTDKQIKYATDLINDYKAKNEKFIAKGKAHKIQDRIEKVELAESLEKASHVIFLFTQWTGDLRGERGLKSYLRIK